MKTHKEDRANENCIVKIKINGNLQIVFDVSEHFK